MRPDVAGLRRARARRAARQRGGSAGVALVLVAGLAGGAAVHAGTVGLTDAAWTDHEHVASAVGTRSSWCEAGLYRTTSRAQLLAGGLLDRDTAGVADVAPLRATNTGTGSWTTPQGARALGGDAWLSALTASALGNAAGSLGGTFSVPLTGADVGLLQQYVRAGHDGGAAAAAGAVSEAGAVDTRTQTPGSGMPDLASVDVRTLAGSTALGRVLGAGPAADLTDVRLVAGAVASSVEQDACVGRASTRRDYGVAALRADARSTALADVGPATARAAGALQGTLGPGGSVVAGLTRSVDDVVRGPVGQLTGMGATSATLVVAVDLPGVVAPFGTRTLGDGTAVRLDLAAGRMTVDLAALMSPGTGVNGRAPNTEVLTAQVLGAAVAAVSTLPSAHATAVLGAVRAALDAAAATLTVTAPLTAPVTGTPVGTLRVVLRGTLGTLQTGRGGEATLTVTECATLAATVCSAVTALGPGLVAPVLAAVGTSLGATLTGPGGAVAVFGTGVASATGRASTTLDALLRGLPDLLSVQVNAQPDGPGARAPSVPVAAGEVAVSALRVGVLDPGRVGWLALGTSTAGPNTYVPPR